MKSSTKFPNHYYDYCIIIDSKSKNIRLGLIQNSLYFFILFSNLVKKMPGSGVEPRNIDLQCHCFAG